MRKFFAALVALVMLSVTFSYTATAAPADPGPTQHQVQVLKQRIHNLRDKNYDLRVNVQSLNSQVAGLNEQVAGLKANLEYNSPEACKTRPLCFNDPAFPAEKVEPDDDTTYRIFVVTRAFGNDYRFYVGPYFNRYAADQAVAQLSTYRYVLVNSIRLEQSPTVWTTVTQ